MGTHPIFESDFDCLTVLEMEMSVPFSRGTKVKGQTTEYCVEIVVSGRLTQTWLRYSELRELSQALKSVKDMPRLAHFPSRLGDNRSNSGVENRRSTLDAYFKSLSRWNLYPKLIETHLNVKIPESLLLEAHFVMTESVPNGLEEDHMIGSEMIGSSNKSLSGLFYWGDKLFNDMESDHIDAVIDLIYN